MTPKQAFLQACRLDVAVRKPGNVSAASPGHGMDAAMFLASAEAAAGPMFTPGRSVGWRIDEAGAATMRVAGCNTNLGILLLCAPIAVALEQQPAARSAQALRDAIEAVLGDLDLDDSRHAFAAIARANPGGLGEAESQDVREAPSLDLRAAMSLAASRDSIADQYRSGFELLFTLGLSAAVESTAHAASESSTGAIENARVQRVYLAYLATVPDSHIVRKRGDALAQGVMREAGPWWQRARSGEQVDADQAFASWDEALKTSGLNPGTSADLTVATLFLSGLIQAPTPAS